MKVVRLSEQASSALTDQALVNRIISGEKELFEILMRRCNQGLYRAIRSYITTEADVEDTMQEAYIKAYGKLDQFRGDASFSSWLIRIGINEALQRIRKRKKTETPAGSSTDWKESMYELSLHKPMDPEKKAIQNETRQLIELAIDRLPEKYRVVYLLKEVENMPYPAIAYSLDITEGNVKVRLHRAKALLKEQLLKMSVSADIFEFGNKHCDLLVMRVMSRL